MNRVANSEAWGEAAWISWHWAVRGCRQLDLAAFLGLPQSKPNHMIAEFTKVWSNQPLPCFYYNRKEVTIDALKQYLKDGGILIEPIDSDVRVARKEVFANYYHARDEHAFLLRCEGLTYKAIAKRLGVSATRADQLRDKFALRLRRAMRRTKYHLGAHANP